MGLSLFIVMLFATSLAVESECDSSRVTVVEELTTTRPSMTPFASVRSYSKNSQCSNDFYSLFNKTDPRGTGFNIRELALDVSGKPGTGLLSDTTSLGTAAIVFREYFQEMMQLTLLLWVWFPVEMFSGTSRRTSTPYLMHLLLEFATFIFEIGLLRVLCSIII